MAGWFAMPALLLAALASAAAAQGVVIGQVSKVHDGDTVTIVQHDGQMLLRLAAIDAPEPDQAFGSESHDSLVACALGRVAVVEVQGTDRHGRTLGILHAAGTDCGLVQLRTGLAWFYRQYAHEQPSRRRLDYRSAEREARKRGIGLWAQGDDAQAPWTYRRLNPRPQPPRAP